MSLAENIRFHRERVGMYQSELGKALGVSAQAISKWELGKAEPDQESILKMCELFGISADQLLGRGQENGVDEAWAIRERLRRDPAYRLLFDAADNASPEHLRAAAAMLKALEPKDGDGE
jgi:transcriptional regulator with XRE-family HTH domain